MKKLLTLFTALIVIVFVAIATTKSMSAPEECCGKCMGKSNCTACSSCKYCAHCSNGGSCGVCSGGNTYTPPPKQETKKQTTVTNNIITTTNEIYTVTAETLNVREGASANKPVVGKLKRGDKVEVLEKTNDEWWKVSYTGADGKMIWGYVSMKYLNK